MTRRTFVVATGAAGVGAVALGAASLTAGMARPARAAAQSSVYLGAFADEGLSVGAVDEASGELTVTGGVDGVPFASFLAFSADRRYLYTTNEQPDGGLTALDLADETTPVVLNRASSRGAGPTHLSVHGSFLLTANYTDGTVVVHRIEDDGRIGESTDLVQHGGGERAPHAHQVVTDPSGQWVLAVDLGADAVFVYALDKATGTLAEHQRLTLPAGAGPRHLAFHPDGGTAYVLGELRAEITVTVWDAAAGRLTPGQVVPTVAEGVTAAPAEIAVSADGHFVYATNRGPDTVAAFTVADAGLTHLSSTPTGGAWPRHLTLDPGERRVYVSNKNSGTVTVLPRDPDTGELGTAASSTSVASVGVVAFH